MQVGGPHATLRSQAWPSAFLFLLLCCALQAGRLIPASHLTTGVLTEITEYTTPGFSCGSRVWHSGPTEPFPSSTACQFHCLFCFWFFFGWFFYCSSCSNSYCSTLWQVLTSSALSQSSQTLHQKAAAQMACIDRSQVPRHKFRKKWGEKQDFLFSG